MPRGRPREFDAEKALDAALLLFWQRGYEGTSLAELSEKMGINMPSLYAAFGSKELLFRKALDRYVERPASYLPKALKEPTARQVVEKLLFGAIEMVVHRGHPDGCLLVQGALASGPDADAVRNELSERRAKAEMAIRRRFELAIKQGDLPRRVNAANLARYVAT